MAAGPRSVETLRALSGAGLERLVEASRTEGFRFLERLVDEWASGANRFDGPDEALFAVRDRDRVIAVCGLNVDPFLDDPRVARLRHLYVLPAERRQGLGRTLVGHALAHARAAGFRRVRLRTDASDAARFYEELGFGPSPEADSATHERSL